MRTIHIIRSVFAAAAMLASGLTACADITGPSSFTSIVERHDPTSGDTNVSSGTTLDLVDSGSTLGLMYFPPRSHHEVYRGLRKGRDSTYLGFNLGGTVRFFRYDEPTIPDYTIRGEIRNDGGPRNAMVYFVYRVGTKDCLMVSTFCSEQRWTERQMVAIGRVGEPINYRLPLSQLVKRDGSIDIQLQMDLVVAYVCDAVADGTSPAIGCFFMS